MNILPSAWSFDHILINSRKCDTQSFCLHYCYWIKNDSISFVMFNILSVFSVLCSLDEDDGEEEETGGRGGYNLENIWILLSLSLCLFFLFLSISTFCLSFFFVLSLHEKKIENGANFLSRTRYIMELKNRGNKR